MVGIVTNFRKLNNVEASLDTWEVQLWVSEKDVGKIFFESVRVFIVSAMISESTEQFVYSSFGVVVD